MAVTNPGFEVVGGTEAELPQTPQADPNKVAIAMILMGLKSLSMRALTAATDLFTLLTVASAFWLWWSIPVPNDRQIISLSIYALFILATNWIVRGRK
jgi:hypothetical protein